MALFSLNFTMMARLLLLVHGMGREENAKQQLPHKKNF